MSDDRPVKRRSPLGISGVLLFVCLFLPTLRVCGDPTAPIEFPPTYGVYLGGLLVGILGFTAARHVRRGLFLGLFATYLVTAGTFLALMAGSAMVPIVGAIVGGIVLSVIVVALRHMVRIKWTERAPATMCIVHAMVSLGWSSLLAFDPDGMWGAVVSLGASSLMLFASIGYAREAFAEQARPDEPALPAARVVA